MMGVGSNWIMTHNEDIKNDINQAHSFVVQFDRRNASDFKCYDVATDAFKLYVASMTNYKDAGNSSFTDVAVLCEDICGVNLSVGYYNEHTNKEYVNAHEWLATLNLARQWLSQKDLPLCGKPRNMENDDWMSQYKDYMDIFDDAPDDDYDEGDLDNGDEELEKCLDWCQAGRDAGMGTAQAYECADECYSEYKKRKQEKEEKLHYSLYDEDFDRLFDDCLDSCEAKGLDQKGEDKCVDDCYKDFKRRETARRSVRRS